jgi:2-haloacid dehalogenase
MFDAYGTLFDVHSVTIAADRIFPGQGSELSKAWRVRQLEYTWLRSLMNRYEDFWKVTESALVAACNAMKLPLDAAARTELMDAYLRLTPFPEVKEALSALSRRPLAILSNGNPKMLKQVVKNAGLEEAFSHVISVDEAKLINPVRAHISSQRKRCVQHLVALGLFPLISSTLRAPRHLGSGVIG